MENVIFSKTLNVQDRQAEIKIINDDLANIQGPYDILVCSAYKNNYVPLRRTVIGALYAMGIDMKELAADPQINCKEFGVWISKETGNPNFKRICCVELLEHHRGGWSKGYYKENDVDIILKKTFSTLKYVIEQASITGVPVKRILLPILGAGSQRIELSYIIPPLVNQIKAILNFYDVEEITFFEIKQPKAELLKKYLCDSLNTEHQTDVFISYSSKQSAKAYEVAGILKKHHISYWMAPDSISPSCDYLDEIPKALTNTKMVLLLLTPEAEASVWVSKEVATAMGANKIVIPCQLVAYDISQKFRFLLDGCQIFAGYSRENYAEELIQVIQTAQ